MEVGDYYENVICESFRESGRIRVRTVGNKVVPDGIFVECSKDIRESHPVGTKFRTENIKVIKKEGLRIHVRAKDHMLYPLI